MDSINKFIKFELGAANIDLLHYHLKYNMLDADINCYVTEYNTDDNEYNINVNDGIVYFYIDNEYIGQETPVDGVATLPITALQNTESVKTALQGGWQGAAEATFERNLDNGVNTVISTLETIKKNIESLISDLVEDLANQDKNLVEEENIINF